MSALIAPFIALALATAAVMPQWPEDQDFDSKYYAWGMACELSRYNCVGVPVLKVRLIKSKAYRGGYSCGDGHIAVNERLQPGDDKHSTMIHEFTHYLQSHSGTVDCAMLKSICYGEDEAHGVTDKFWIAQGRADMIRGDDWWVGYPKCWHWFAPPPMEGFNVR